MKKILTVSALAVAGALFAAPAFATSYPYPVVTGDLLFLGATTNEVLAQVDTNNTTYRVDNGLQWFNYNERDEVEADGGIGFAHPTATLNLDSCDTDTNNFDVMCWHNVWDQGNDEIHLTEGHRWDLNQNASSADGFFRVMFESDDPGYYPSGAQYDVPLADLDGWTACWADDWGSDWGVLDSSYTDIFSACDGDYLMMAVADNVVAGDPPATDLAETGVDVAPIVGAGAVALVVGATVVARRRRTN